MATMAEVRDVSNDMTVAPTPGTAATRPRGVALGLVWSLASSLSLRAGNLVVSVVMARLIAPEQFGVFAVALTVWVILGSLAEFGLGSDLIRAQSVEARIPTVSTIGLSTSTSLALLMYLTAPALAAAFDSPASTGVIRLLSISLVLTGISIAPAALLAREFRQRALFGINGVGLVVSAGVMTGLAVLGAGPAALAWGQLSSQLVTTILQFVAARRRPVLGFDRKIARESAAFSLPLAFANLLSWVLLSVDNLVVARSTNAMTLGFYVLAFNVSSWPMNAVGQAIRVVALPAFGRMTAAKDRNAALVRVSGPIWAVCVLFGALLISLATSVISVLYGDRWQPAAGALMALGAFGAMRIMLDFLATFLISTGATRAVLVVQVWWIVTLVPAMIVGVHLGGLAGAGWAHVVVAAVAILPAYVFCLHRAGVDWRLFLGSWWWPTVAVIPCAAALWFIAREVRPALLTLGVAGLVGPVVFVLPLARWVRHHIRSIKSLHHPITTSEGHHDE